MIEFHVRVARWYREDGQIIRRDEPMFELETDEAYVDVPAPYDGVLHQLAKAGDVVHRASDIVRIDPIE